MQQKIGLKYKMNIIGHPTDKVKIWTIKLDQFNHK